MIDDSLGVDRVDRVDEIDLALTAEQKLKAMEATLKQHGFVGIDELIAKHNERGAALANLPKKVPIETRVVPKIIDRTTELKALRTALETQRKQTQVTQSQVRKLRSVLEQREKEVAEMKTAVRLAERRATLAKRDDVLQALCAELGVGVEGLQPAVRKMSQACKALPALEQFARTVKDRVGGSSMEETLENLDREQKQHLHALFDVGKEGLIPALNKVYVRLHELEAFQKTIASILDVPPQKIIPTLLGRE